MTLLNLVVSSEFSLPRDSSVRSAAHHRGLDSQTSSSFLVDRCPSRASTPLRHFQIQISLSSHCGSDSRSPVSCTNDRSPFRRRSRSSSRERASSSSLLARLVFSVSQHFCSRNSFSLLRLPRSLFLGSRESSIARQPFPLFASLRLRTSSDHSSHFPQVASLSACISSFSTALRFSFLASGTSSSRSLSHATCSFSSQSLPKP